MDNTSIKDREDRDQLENTEEIVIISGLLMGESAIIELAYLEISTPPLSRHKDISTHRHTDTTF